MGHSNSNDGLATVGEIRKIAWIWTIATAIGSTALVYNLAKIDRGMFDSKAPFPLVGPHRENRAAQASVPSDTLDSRKASTLTFVEGELRR